MDALLWTTLLRISLLRISLLMGATLRRPTISRALLITLRSGLLACWSLAGRFCRRRIARRLFTFASGC